MNKRECITCGRIDFLSGEVRAQNCRGCAMRKHRTGTGRKDRGNTGGYRMIYVNGTRIYEHRHIMEQYLGRKLSRKEHVHHRDGNKINNSLNNLELVNPSDHARDHISKRAREMGMKGHAVRWGYKEAS